MKFKFRDGMEIHTKSTHVTNVHTCGDCEYKTQNKHYLAIHKAKYHTENRTLRRESDHSHKYSLKEKTKNGPCHFWNCSTCKFAEDQCRFLHQEIPACHFQERCRNIDQCRFFHFVGKTTRFRGSLRKEIASPPTNRSWGRNL